MVLVLVVRFFYCSKRLNLYFTRTKFFIFVSLKRFMSFNKLRPVDAMFVQISLPLYVKRKVTNVDSVKSGMSIFRPKMVFLDFFAIYAKFLGRV